MIPSCLSQIQLFANPMDCSPPGSSVHKTLQVRTLKWIAISSSRASSQTKDGTHVFYVPALAGRFFIRSTTWETLHTHTYTYISHLVYLFIYL